jgi:hypothetical protein
MQEVEDITIQGVKFSVAVNNSLPVVNFFSDNLEFRAMLKEDKSLEELLINAIKNAPIQKKSIIKTNVYLKNELQDCDGDAFDKLVNVVVNKHDFDGFIDAFSKGDSKSFIIPIDNIELIEKIYIPIFKDL